MIRTTYVAVVALVDIAKTECIALTTIIPEAVSFMLLPPLGAGDRTVEPR